MTLPEPLEAKFDTLLRRYPVKRSALVPMLLYAQDQFGQINDAMIEEIAQRLDLNVLQVTETLAYYSMLRRKPAGKYHVQVCTNVSCMLRGGNRIYEHVQRNRRCRSTTTSTKTLPRKRWTRSWTISTPATNPSRWRAPRARCTSAIRPRCR